MDIVKKQINNEYWKFFTSYCESLKSVSNQEWDYHNVAEAVNYMQSRNDLGILSNSTIPIQFSKAEYLCLEEEGSLIPPGCMWISKSGRYTCHDIYTITGFQSYILWDLRRRVLLPLVFHDLMGMDEEEGILFCRTMSPIHRDGHSSPMRIDLDWIDILQYSVSLPDDYPPEENKSFSDKELYDIAGKGVLQVRCETDLFNLIEFHLLEDLSNRNIKLLDNADISEKEKKNLVGEILFHPHFGVKFESWVFDALFAYSEDIAKCHTIASFFGFEDIVEETYDEWKHRMINEAERKRQIDSDKNKNPDMEEQDYNLPF